MWGALMPPMIKEIAGGGGAAREDTSKEALRFKMQPHLLAINGLQQKYAALDPQAKDYSQNVDQITQELSENIGEVRRMMTGDKTPEDAAKGNIVERGVTDRLLLTNPEKRKEKAEKKEAGDVSGARSYEQGTVPYEQTREFMTEHQKALDALRLQQEKEKGAQNRPPAGRPVPFGQGSISAKDAKQFAENGMEFKDQDGNPLDVSKLPDGSKVTPWAYGGKIFYTIGDQRPRVVTADNQRTVQPEEGALAPAGQAPSLGAARVGNVRTATAPGGGQVVTGTSTPETPHGSPQPHGEPHSFAGPKTKSLDATRGAQTAETEGVLPNIANMTPQNAAAARKAQPAVTALLGLYGDPQSPNAPSMMNYAKLADNPHSQKVLGEAFKLLDQQMGEISDPGILQTLGTAAGWANFRARAEAGAQQSAGTEMTPEERSYFDAAISSMADIIGSRAATGQSAARFSVRSIQNELPLIGLSGTPDSTSYLTKMQTIGRQIRVGLNGMPDNSRAIGWLNKREADIEREKSGGAILHSGKPKIRVQHSASTGKDRYSTDGGATWLPGKPPTT